MQTWCLAQFKRSPLGVENEPANRNNQQGIGMSMRQMPHEPVHPDKYLQISNAQRRRRKPGHSLFFRHLPGEDVSCEMHDGPGAHKKAQVKPGAQRHQDLVRIEAGNGPRQGTHRDERVEQE